ncbi:hypothetical protein Ssi03_73470 [Sphaerisporangium siamense]|uniref:Uncharacterized protein n=1 Tax=Sphaerisporangium siamense TaxID=795645 RepID=A0A7W7D6C4_9ACTN|nr:hypothetical protein [Sphaerisporangium siamense]MBB4701102.1 hypothetical protein [Sphaerisporangium siamense]GII89357.1 hypothetical protein Ssi03_73470 [Sphaerisporangium siamense]
MHKPIGRSVSAAVNTLDWEVTPVKLISMPMSALPRAASLHVDASASATRVGHFVAPTAPEVLVLEARSVAKLRQEQSARVQAERGMGAFAYRRTAATVADLPAVFGPEAGDPQTTSPANGGEQGPPSWRPQPVTT